MSNFQKSNKNIVFKYKSAFLGVWFPICLVHKHLACVAVSLCVGDLWRRSVLDHQGPQYDSSTFLSPLFRLPGEMPPFWLHCYKPPHAFFGEPAQSISLGKCLPPVFLWGSKPLSCFIPFSKLFLCDILESFQAPNVIPSKTETESELISSSRMAPTYDFTISNNSILII